jgi:hypothetical protein
MTKQQVLRILKNPKSKKEEIAKAMKSYWQKYGSSYKKALDVFFSDETST